jgi:hypothetical protein
MQQLLLVRARLPSLLQALQVLQQWERGREWRRAQP